MSAHRSSPPLSATFNITRIIAQSVDALEPRRLLSSTIPTPPLTVQPLPNPTLPPLHIIPKNSPAYASSITPTAYAESYGLNNIMFGSTVGNGAGQTIAIVDAYDCPTLVDTGASGFASSDLAVFDSAYGLPDPPEFLKVNQNGGTTLPTGSGATAESDSIETELDVEYAHAMAPEASIILVEANSPAGINLWPISMNTAREIPNVSAISLSWGSAETSPETANDTAFQTPAGHNGITFSVASGDTAYGNLDYPAASPYVVGAGGTVLFENNGTYGYETAWADSTGGISQYEPKPSYQSEILPGVNNRLVPDLSMDAGTQVIVYDTDGFGGYLGVEGDSIVAPAFAGAMALVNQGRALEGLGSLNGFTQSLPRMYGWYDQFLANNVTAYDDDFHDITLGSSGPQPQAQAAVGYDLVTGLGSPIGQNFVPNLAGGATLAGIVYDDENSNGNFDAGEPGISGVQVYVDVNNTGSYVAGDPTTTTDANGNWSIQDDVAGFTNLTVREVVPTGFTETGPTAPSFTTSYNAQYSANFGNVSQFPALISGPSSNIYVRLDPTGTTIQVFYGANSSGTLAYSISKAALGDTAETFQTIASSGDTLTIDYSNGDPMNTSGQFTFAPASGATNANLVIEGTPASATMSVSSSGVVVDGQSIPTAASVTSVTLDAAGSNSSMSVNFTSNPFSGIILNGQSSSDSISLTGTNTGATTVAYAFAGSSESLSINTANPYTITGDAAMGATGGVALTDTGPLTLLGNQTLTSLQITGAGSITLGRTNPAVASVITATSLSIAPTAYLDLDDNGMAINYAGDSPIDQINGYLQTGYAGGNWNGFGIRSASAANDFTQSTAIGAIDNQALASLGENTYSSFMGVPVSANSVLMRYTYYGDTDLSGVVDSVDFGNFIAGIQGNLSGWLVGDFDYSGAINGVDFGLFIVGLRSQ